MTAQRCRSLRLAPVVLLVSTVASAQDAPLMTSGSRLRVSTRVGAPLVGLLQSTDATSMTLDVAGQGATTIARSDVVRVELSTGQRSRARQGLLVGALVGTGLGILLGQSNDSPEGCDGWDCGTSAVLVGAAAGVALGAGVGALLKTEGWEDVPANAVRLSFVPARGGVRAALTVRW